MSDFKALMDVVGAFGTPCIIVVGWMVWRIYSNHLPHIAAKLDNYNTRISTLEGHQNLRLRRENGKRRSK